MTTHKTGTREQWLKARLDLLKRRRNSHAEATSWRARGRICRGRQSIRVSLRNRRGKRLAGRPFPWTLAALVYHLCSGLTSPLAVPLARHRRRLQRHRCTPVQSYVMLWPFHAPRLQAASVQASDGLDVPLGLLSRGDFNFDFCASYTQSNRARAASNTTIARGALEPRTRRGRDLALDARWLRCSRLCAERTRRRTLRETGRAHSPSKRA